MTYQNVPYADAVEAAHKGLPFTICWEFTGANDKNKSGASDKFWLIERNFVGNTRHGSVFRRFGKRGQSGTRQEIPSVAHGLLQGRGKEKKGYVFSFASVYGSKTGEAKPLISKTLPPPFCHIRMVHEAPIGTWCAYDSQGNVVVTLAADTAAEIIATYTLA